jgi:hypothetical protein
MSFSYRNVVVGGFNAFSSGLLYQFLAADIESKTPKKECPANRPFRIREMGCPNKHGGWPRLPGKVASSGAIVGSLEESFRRCCPRETREPRRRIGGGDGRREDKPAASTPFPTSGRSADGVSKQNPPVAE